MQIQRLGKSGYSFSDSSTSFALNHDKLDETLSLIVDTKSIFKNEDKRIVKNNGEYEFSDITVLIYKLDEKFKNDINYALISHQGLNILWLSGEVVELSKDLIENLPQVHLLILSLAKENKLIEKQVDMVSEIEPNYITIDVDSKDTLAEFQKQYGEVPEEMKKLKIKKEDFSSDEDVATKFINLI